MAIMRIIIFLSLRVGEEPLIIARGGFTGLFPEGSSDAIGISQDISIFLCNLHFTKDIGAFCVTGIKLDNTTNIAMFDPKEKTYNINGKDVQGHFLVDYTGAQIDQNVSSETSTNLLFFLTACVFCFKLCHD